MHTVFLEQAIRYDGTQLAPHWILKTCGLKGDAVASFTGPCRVEGSQLVDLEDSLSGHHIYSSSMLHFIAEHFDSDLERMILRQRIFISILQQILVARTGKKEIVRRGDDLYLGDFKLSVSIATTSPVSCLMHTGINIQSEGTPVATKGLADFDVDPRKFATDVLMAYAKEMEEIRWARCKVRSVS